MDPSNGFRTSANQAGFTLIEVTLTLAILSLTIALALPRTALTGGTTSLRIKAFEIVAVLRADRDEAIRIGQPVTSHVDVRGGRVVSSVANGSVSLPPGVIMRVSVQALDGIRFQPDGSTTGGEIYLMRTDRSGLLSVRVNPLTAAVEIDGNARYDE